MKNLVIIFLFIFVSFKSYSNEIENKGLICNSFEKKPKIVKDKGFLYSVVDDDLFSYGFWFNELETSYNQGAFKDIFKDLLKNYGNLEMWKQTIKYCNTKSDNWSSDCNTYVFEKYKTGKSTYEVTDFDIKIYPYGNKNSILDNMKIDRLNLHAKKSISSKYKYWCKAYEDKKIFLKEIYGMPYEDYIKEKEKENKELDEEYNNKLKKRIF